MVYPESSGHKVLTKLYEGCRHEIHNYNSLKDEVETGIIDFFRAAAGI